MVYPSKDGHPSKYWPGPMLINFVDQTNVANHYTTPTNTYTVSIITWYLSVKEREKRLVLIDRWRGKNWQIFKRFVTPGSEYCGLSWWCEFLPYHCIYGVHLSAILFQLHLQKPLSPKYRKIRSSEFHLSLYLISQLTIAVQRYYDPIYSSLRAVKNFNLSHVQCLT